MKKNNKKGFTLVELLAVIVILAVVVLIAMTAVVPQMEKARKNAFVTEANKFIQGATNYYTDCQIKTTGSCTNMAASGGCVTIQTLITNGYIDKKAATSHSGYVKIANTSGTASYTISFSDGNYHTGTTAGTAAEINVNNLTAANVQTSAVTITAPNNCD